MAIYEVVARSDSIQDIMKTVVHVSGLSQNQFAAKHKVSPSYVQKIIKGLQKNPSESWCKKVGIVKVERKVHYEIWEQKEERNVT